LVVSLWNWLDSSSKAVAYLKINILTSLWGISSGGRAPDSKSDGQRFNSAIPQLFLFNEYFY